MPDPRIAAQPSPAHELPSYPAYQQCAAPWLDRIPTHWRPAPMKSVLARNDGGAWGDDDPVDGTIVLRSTEQTADGRWCIDNPATRSLTARERRETRLTAGDLVVTKSSGSALHIGKTSLVNNEVEALSCSFSNFMQRLRLRDGHEPRFFWYAMNSPVAREQFVYLSNSVTGLGNLNATLLGSVELPIPPANEQRAIAAFLDRETAKIDELVAKKERLIELLAEDRSATITRAVTRGLDADATMTKSSHPWIGETPTHWSQVALKKLVDPARPITYGIVQCGPNVPDGVPYIRPVDMSDEAGVDPESLQRTSHEIASTYRRSTVRPGDLVVSIGPSFGKVMIVPEELEGANLTQGTARVAAGRDAAPEFLYWCLRSYTAWAAWDSHCSGATFRSLTLTTLSECALPLPPLNEQCQIAEHLQGATAHLDSVTVVARNVVKRLHDLRTALISAAVTGKIDVREST